MSESTHTVIQISFGRVVNSEWHCVHTFDFQADVDPPPSWNVYTTPASWYILNAMFIPIWPNTFQSDMIRLRFRNSTRAGEIYDFPHVVRGNRIGDLLPTQDAISLKRVADATSRRGRGRLFIAPVMDDFRSGTDSDKIDTNHPDLAFLRNRLATFVGAGPVGTRWYPCLWHRDTNTSSLIQYWQYNELVCTMRSRRGTPSAP